MTVEHDDVLVSSEMLGSAEESEDELSELSTHDSDLSLSQLMESPNSDHSSNPQFMLTSQGFGFICPSFHPNSINHRPLFT